MLKAYIIINIILVCSFQLVFSQENESSKSNLLSKEEMSQLQIHGSKSHFVDSLSNIITHGVYLEFAGRNGLYSLGYEFMRKMNRHRIGFGLGTSIYRYTAPGKAFPNYNLNLSPYYEYGKGMGFRLGFNTTFGINPIMFTSRLDHLHPADKPPIYILIPSNSFGIFYNTKNQQIHFSINGYLMYRTLIYENRFTSEILPWFGCSIKYNFKIDNK